MGAPFYTSSDGIFLYHQRLSAYKWLRHGFSLRRNQDGAEMSYSLNGFQPRETVLKNRQRLVRSVSGRESPLAICGRCILIVWSKPLEPCWRIHLKVMAG